MDLKDLIRSIEDYPIEGVIFRDITTLLKDKDGLCMAIDKLVEMAGEFQFNKIVAPEARGFIVGTPVAYAMKKSFVPVRKPGKLPADIIRKSYELEYGEDFLEIHKDAIEKGDKVVIIDDLLATAGTTKAMVELLEDMGAEVVACIYLIELSFLNGREKLEGYETRSCIVY